MPETGFSRFIQILHKLRSGLFGPFDQQKWTFIGKHNFTSADNKYVQKTLVNNTFFYFLSHSDLNVIFTTLFFIDLILILGSVTTNYLQVLCSCTPLQQWGGGQGHGSLLGKAWQSSGLPHDTLHRGSIPSPHWGWEDWVLQWHPQWQVAEASTKWGKTDSLG